MIVVHDPQKQLMHQLNAFYPCGGDVCLHERIKEVYDRVLERLEICFSHVNNKYYHNNGEVFFNPLHVSQWTIFLYIMANELNKKSDTDICDMIYGLNKMVSSADIFYGVEMPKIWFCDHPQGSVMGRAKYSDFFTFSQGCTVGNNKGIYPVFEKHVTMFSNSKVLGKSHIGDHVIFSANSYVIDMDIPSWSIVFGAAPHNIIKQITAQKFNEITSSMFSGNDE